ncbi:MAG: chemotaxis protein CheB [Candidatus Hydrothermarchaeales archaeon]
MKIRVMMIGFVDPVRQVFSDTLESRGGVDVVSKLSDCRGAIEMLEWVRPDVVLAELLALEEDETGFFKTLLKERVPLVVTLENKKNQLNRVFEYLEKGAVDCLILPKDKRGAIKKVKAAARTHPINLKGRLKPLKITFPGAGGVRKVFVIASSTGGPQALRAIIPKLPQGLPAAVIVVQHMGKGFTTLLAKRLDKISAISVEEARDGQTLKGGCAYVAPYGHHLGVEKSKIFLVEGPPINGVIPSADYTMSSVAQEYGGNSTAVVLTGMGRDGGKGAGDIKAAGGRVIVQDQESSVVFGMPQVALKTGCVDKVVELSGIAGSLAKEVYV